MARVEPTPIPPHPDLPQRSDRPTFAVRSDAYVDWQANVMAPGIETLAEQTLTNAEDAHSSAVAAAADREQTGLDRQAVAADREQTGEDRLATAADRAATAADRAATTADRVQTGEDRQAVADMLDDIAGGPVASINGKTGVVRLYESDITPLQVVDASTNATEGVLYGVDTSDGDVTITLPADPTPGMRIPLADVVGVWGDTPPIVARNGQRIMGLEEDLVLDVQYLSLALLYINSSRGWVIV